MAPFLSRLLNIQKRISPNLRTEIPEDLSKRNKSVDFDGSKQVRVLLFRELNGAERRLLFDSKAVRKMDPASLPSTPLPRRGRQDSSIEKSFKLGDAHSKDYIYEWQKSSSDENLLREMIFGAVSISYQGTTLKVHVIRSPSQIMFSVVFPAPPLSSSRNGDPENEESVAWNSSVELKIERSVEVEEDSCLAHSVPVNVPSRFPSQYGDLRENHSNSSSPVDGYNSLPSTSLTPEGQRGVMPRSSSYNSLQRRILRNKATSIEMGLPKELDKPPLDYSRTPGQKRSKLGLSIVINLSDGNKPEDKHLRNFLFTHISLIESHIMTLKNTVGTAYLNRRNFVHLMFEGSRKFQMAIEDLYTAPRLTNPEWLTIISSPNHRHLSYSFLEKFSNLLKLYDKKETNFFVTTLLTAVLTHHLSWVPSVIPTDAKIQNTHSSHKHTPGWVDLLAKSRPYNPLWVQLSDLYGALGNPIKLTRTVVKGQKKEMVHSFLRILSYFIRCSDICHQLYEKSEDVAPKEGFTPWLSSSQDSSSYCTNKTETKALSNNSSLNTVVDGFSLHSPAAKQCLPHNSPALNTASDCASTCSMDNDGESSSLPHTVGATDIRSIKPKVEPVPILSKEPFTSSDLESLGYMSLEEKVESVNCARRFALREQPSNCCSVTAASSHAACMKQGKENNPVISVSNFDDRKPCCKSNCCRNMHSATKKSATMCLETRSVSESNDDSEDNPITFGIDWSRCCASIDSGALRTGNVESPISSLRCLCRNNSELQKQGGKSVGCACPCYDNPVERKSGRKTRESESVEEGYHSMEEPHSPSREGSRLAEMLRKYNYWCPEGCEEKFLPGLQRCEKTGDSSPYNSIGWSLMADVSDHYLPDFCLQGLSGPLNHQDIRDDLVRANNSHVLGEPIGECVCVLADTDKWKVEVISGRDFFEPTTPIVMSSLVSGICDALLNMVQLRIPPESCIIYLEDRLQELYTRSQALADYVQGSRGPVHESKVASTLNIDESDLPLLLAIAGTHSHGLSVITSR